MSNGVNKVILVCHLGRDPEPRYTASGQAVCTLRVAVSERRKDGDGWKEHVEWLDVVTWGKTAENCGQYLKKGSQAYVEGRIQTREYDDKDGNKRRATEVVASQVIFLGGGGGSTGRDRQSQPKDDATTPATNTGGGGFIDDDLPF